MRTATLREVAPAQPASFSPRASDKVWLLNLDQIEANSGRILERVIGLASEAGSSTRVFDEGNVLYSKLRPYLNKVVCPDGPGIATTELVPLRPDPDVLDRQYLTRFLRSEQFVHWASNEVAGAKMPRVSMNAFWNKQIPLPSIPEQKRIAEILDAADALRTKRREALAQLDTLLQSTFLDMFGDPVTNPKKWQIVNVGDEVNFLTSGSRGWAKYYSLCGDRFIRIQNLKSGRLDLSDIAFVNAPHSAESKRTRVKPGDVLLSITADLGRTAVVPEEIGEAYINQHLAILRFKDMNPIFVAYQLASAGGQVQFAQMNRGGVKAGLNFDDVKSIRLTKPPINLQRRYGSVVEQIEQQKTKLQSHLAELQALFVSLQSRAFQGRL